MPHTGRTCHRKFASWLALFVVAFLLLSGRALPGAQAARQAPLTGPDQPTLSVTVTDPDNNPMTVSLYGRVESAAAPDFMLVLIPDPQNESQYNVNMFKSQTQWMVDNKAANNIVYVTATGDMVNTSNSTTEYGNADTAVDILDAGGVRYTMAPGNHDNPGYYSPLRYPDYFGVSRYASHLVANGGWFGGSYDDYNTYSLFSASGMDFILINLQYSPSAAILSWAETLMNTYSTRRVIVESHSILNVNNSFTTEGTTLYNALRDHNNLFLMLCGHMHSNTDGAAYVAGTGTGGAGQTIHIVQADYQDVNSGNGYLRLFRFSPADDMIYMTTYSPSTGGSLTADPDQKNLAYVMPDAPLAAPQAPIVTSITQDSGNVILDWNPVTEDTSHNPPMIDEYRVYGSSEAPYFEPSDLNLLGTPTPLTGTTFTHATGGANWYYLVRAHNAADESAVSDPRKGRFGFTLVPGELIVRTS